MINFKWKTSFGLITLILNDSMVMAHQIPSNDNSLIIRATNHDKKWECAYFDGSLSDATKKEIEDWFVTNRLIPAWVYHN